MTKEELFAILASHLSIELESFPQYYEYIGGVRVKLLLDGKIISEAECCP